MKCVIWSDYININLDEYKYFYKKKNLWLFIVMQIWWQAVCTYKSICLLWLAHWMIEREREREREPWAVSVHSLVAGGLLSTTSTRTSTHTHSDEWVCARLFVCVCVCVCAPVCIHIQWTLTPTLTHTTHTHTHVHTQTPIYKHWRQTPSDQFTLKQRSVSVPKELAFLGAKFVFANWFHSPSVTSIKKDVPLSMRIFY